MSKRIIAFIMGAAAVALHGQMSPVEMEVFPESSSPLVINVENTNLGSSGSGNSIKILPWNPFNNEFTGEDRYQEWWDEQNDPEATGYEAMTMPDVEVHVKNSTVEGYVSVSDVNGSNEKVAPAGQMTMTVDATSTLAQGAWLTARSGNVNFANAGTANGSIGLSAANGVVSASHTGNLIAPDNSGYSIEAGSRADFVNEGTIVASSGGLSVRTLLNGSSGTIVNKGLIQTKNRDTVSLTFEGGTFEFTNTGEINMGYGLSRSGMIVPMAERVGAALHVTSGSNGGLVVNSGKIHADGNAILCSSSNVIFDLREGSSIIGDVVFDTPNGGITLKLNNVSHAITGGVYMSVTPNEFARAAGGNIISITMNNIGAYGRLVATGEIEMDNAILELDTSLASLNMGEMYEIISSETGITGSFYGLQDGDTVQSGNYEFVVHYDMTGETLTGISLEVVSQIPEHAGVAVALGFAALLLAAFKRRKTGK